MKKYSKKIKKIKENIYWWLFKTLLKRFCNKSLDQWERWEMDTKYGPVYVSISRKDDGYGGYDKLS